MSAIRASLEVAAHGMGGGVTVAPRLFEVQRKMAACSPVLAHKFNL